MKTTIKVGAALLGAVSFSAISTAADLPLRTAPPAFAPPPVLASGWDGFYAGTTYGYGFTDFRTRQLTSRSREFDGQVGGGLVGANFQAGHWVFGAEGSIDLNVVRGNIGSQPGLNASHVDSLYDVRFRGRLGYEFGWFMPFVAGGGVYNETYQSVPNVPGFGSFGSVHDSFGWTVGGGVDVKVNPHGILPFLPESIFGPLIVRGEFIHDELPARNYTIAGPLFAQTFRTESSTNLFRLALIYRFGDTAPRPYADSLGNVNWGGGYGGVFGGYGSVDTRNRFAGFPSTKIDGDGGIGGLYAGTNFMFFNNKVMLGIEGSTNWSDISGKGTEPTLLDPVRYREYVQADVRGRLGYAFGNFLPFVSAGIAFTRSEQRDTFNGAENGRIAADNFEFGGGLDYRITQRMSLRGEYLRQSAFSNKTINLTGLSFKQDRDADIFRFGAAYHFE